MLLDWAVGGGPGGVAHQVSAHGPQHAGAGPGHDQPHQDIQTQTQAADQEGWCSNCSAHLKSKKIFFMFINTFFSWLMHDVLTGYWQCTRAHFLEDIINALIYIVWLIHYLPYSYLWYYNMNNKLPQWDYTEKWIF